MKRFILVSHFFCKYVNMSCYMTTKHSFRTVEPFHNNDRHPQNAINLEIKKYAKTNMLAIVYNFSA